MTLHNPQLASFIEVLELDANMAAFQGDVAGKFLPWMYWFCDNDGEAFLSSLKNIRTLVITRWDNHRSAAVETIRLCIEVISSLPQIECIRFRHNIDLRPWLWQSFLSHGQLRVLHVDASNEITTVAWDDQANARRPPAMPRCPSLTSMFVGYENLVRPGPSLTANFKHALEWGLLNLNGLSKLEIDMRTSRGKEDLEMLNTLAPAPADPLVQYLAKLGKNHTLPNLRQLRLRYVLSAVQTTTEQENDERPMEWGPAIAPRLIGYDLDALLTAEPGAFINVTLAVGLACQDASAYKENKRRVEQCLPRLNLAQRLVVYREEDATDLRKRRLRL
jgi:hypothetical protein